MNRLRGAVGRKKILGKKLDFSPGRVEDIPSFNTVVTYVGLDISGLLRAVLGGV